ncbi:hypothetical protein AB0387_21885 [Streptomyces sp. NPDC089173]|uniref:hypothetical protein n=2 Tax=unclassified Streptomyces TaxID=2593676 RepID=UPI00344B28E0
MGNSPYTRERLAEAISASANWTDLMRRLGLPENGGRRRTLQRKAAEFGLDNRAENLRYLCPNCHALTETWCRKGRRTKSITT